MTWRWRWLTAAAALAVLSVMAGCSTHAERLYRRAEAFLAQGQITMAADEYRRLVQEHPRSPLADDALYKLAYVYAEEMDQPSAALIQYRALADDYPESPYIDDALMRVLTIQGQVLKHPRAATATYEELCERFPDRRSLRARGLLEVARAYFEAEQYADAATQAGAVAETYPAQTREGAQAALLQARAAERVGDEQEHVEDLYERVIELYPETHAAAMAKQRIGWFYFGKREEQQQQQAEERRRRSRVIEGVPAHAEREGQVLQALSVLRAALRQRGEDRSLQMLATLSGAPFVTVFDPERPALARSALDGNPLEIVAEALGFAHNVWSGDSAGRAFETVHQAVLQGRPVIVLYGSPRRWTLVTGYDMTEDRVHYLPPGREDYAAIARAEFLSAWADASASDSGVAGPQPFHQFSLGARLQTPTRAEVLRACMRRASQVMHLGELSGAPAGIAAWEAASRHLEGCIAGPDEYREQAVAWADGGLGPHLRTAEMATEPVRAAAEVMPELREVPERYEELLTEAELLAEKIHEAADAEGPDPDAWQAATAQANYVGALHARLAGQLADAANGG